jgi:hypothetical protein
VLELPEIWIRVHADRSCPESLGESQYVKALEGRVAELESLNPQQSQDHMMKMATHEAGREDDVRATHGGAKPSLSQPSGENSTHEHQTSGQEYSHDAPGPAEGCNGPADSSCSPGVSTRSILPNNSWEPISRAAWTAEDGDDDGLDHLIFGLVTSPSVPRDDNSERSPNVRDSAFAERLQQTRAPERTYPLTWKNSCWILIVSGHRRSTPSSTGIYT